MVEKLIGSPFVVGFEHVLTDFDAPVQVYTAQGQPAGMQLQKQPKQLTMNLNYYSNEISLGGYNYTFGKEVGEFISVDELTAAAGIDPDAVWQAAFDAARELFEATKDPAAGAEATGVTFYPKLQVVRCKFDPASTMEVVFFIGIYAEPEYKTLANMIQMQFQDSKTYGQRPVTLAQYEKTITVLDQFLAGTHPNQANMDAEQLAQSKADAANDKRIRLAQIEQHKRALVGPMSAVLSIPAVQQAFGAMTRAVFVELKAKRPECKDWNIDALMEKFPDALAGVIGA